MSPQFFQVLSGSAFHPPVGWEIQVQLFVRASFSFFLAIHFRSYRKPGLEILGRGLGLKSSTLGGFVLHSEVQVITCGSAWASVLSSHTAALAFRLLRYLCKETPSFSHVRPWYLWTTLCEPCYQKNSYGQHLSPHSLPLVLFLGTISCMMLVPFFLTIVIILLLWQYLLNLCQNQCHSEFWLIRWWQALGKIFSSSDANGKHSQWSDSGSGTITFSWIGVIYYLSLYTWQIA